MTALFITVGFVLCHCHFATFWSRYGAFGSYPARNHPLLLGVKRCDAPDPWGFITIPVKQHASVVTCVFVVAITPW